MSEVGCVRMLACFWGLRRARSKTFSTPKKKKKLLQAPAFTKSRSRDRGRGRDWVTRGQAQIQGLISVASSPPLLRFGSSNRAQVPRLDNSGRALGGLSLESAAPPETTASIAEIGLRAPQLGSSGVMGGGVDAESAPPPEMSSSVAETTGVDISPRASEEQPGGATVTGRTEEEVAPSPEIVVEAEAAFLEGARSRGRAVTGSGGGSGGTFTGKPAGAPAESLIVSKSDHVAAAVCTTGGGGAADSGGGKGLTHPPGPSTPCYGGSVTGDGREVSPSELEGGQTGLAKADIVADFTAEGGLDVVAAGGATGGIDVENGGNVVDGNMSGIPSVSPARLVTVAP